MATCGLSAPPPNATSCERYFLRRGRGKAVVDEALGESFSGVLVSDCYAAYHHYDGPQAAVLGPPAAGHPRPAHPLPQRRRTGPMGRGSPPALCRSQSLQPSRAMAKACCPTGLGAEAAGHLPALSCTDPSAVQGKLCRRIERHIKELFVFVAEPDVPADNNAAERSLRHLVISRKVSGGTRSERGTESKMTLASIFGTWRAQGLNPLAACRQLLVSPRL